MTSQKSLEETEDIILRKIFLIKDTEKTVAEIGGKCHLLSRVTMESDLIHRVYADFPGESPFTYLVGCYKRADEEIKKISRMKDLTRRSEMTSAAEQAKKLAVSYVRFFINPELPSSTLVVGSPLLPLIVAEVSRGAVLFRVNDLAGGVECPPGFLGDFFNNSDFYTLDPILRVLYEDLRETVVRVSVLGNFEQPLRALLYLVKLPVAAKSLINHPRWIPKGDVTGRDIEMTSILGPFLHVSALPDHADFRSLPDVGLTGMDDAYEIKTMSECLYLGLVELFECLLKNGESQERLLQYLAEAINKNASRAQIQVDPISSASSGMFVNLSAVMLQICGPLLRASSTIRDKIDVNYVFYSNRLDFRGLTSLNSTLEEHGDGQNRLLKSHEATSSGSTLSVKPTSTSGEKAKYPIDSEIFFMTARVLNLGLMKAFSDYKHLIENISRCEDTLATIKAMQEQAPSGQLQLEISRLEREMELYSQEKFCYEAQILGDENMIEWALSFYRLMVVWLVGLVGGFKMPLPSSCPMEFASMPEHFVEDAMDLLIFASLIPSARDSIVLDDFMNFIIMFMGSHQFIKNPYLRAKMVEVLNCWIPHRSGSSTTAKQFVGQLSSEYLVRNLLKLYIEMEFTGSDTQFYDKFKIRHCIAELLKYLLQVLGHRNTLKQIAKEEEKGVYLSFLNFLINDSIYLLDESLEKTVELKRIKAEMSNTAEWDSRTAQERQESTLLFRSYESIIPILMKLANENVSMLAFTSEQITSPFLLPEMVERVASMLNYFLLKLVGKQRKSLALKDRKKYEFHPKELLKQIVRIYVHLGRGDAKNIFSAAISRDDRSNYEQLFTDAAAVLPKIREDERIIQEFTELGAKAKAAASKAMDTEAALGDIPDEFLDPIQYTLMKDPVILPSSGNTVDRPVIQRHLLSDNTDPFNRSHLTVDMLIPNTELKAKIEEFLKRQSSKG